MTSSSPLASSFSKQYNGSRIKGVELFEIGSLEGVTDLDSFARRVNRHVFVNRKNISYTDIRGLFNAIDDSGRLASHAELVVFGRWLSDGMPGRKVRPGRPPDRKKVLMVAAAGFAALETKGKNFGSSGVSLISPAVISQSWATCFEEVTGSRDHSAKVGSLLGILPDYLSFLASGAFKFKGILVTSSPIMSDLSRALRRHGRGRTQHSIEVTAPPSAIVVANKFEIPLDYSSPAKKTEYRSCLGPASGQLPVLSYTLEPAKPTSDTMHASRAGRVVLRPNINVAKSIRITVLIDRMAFSFRTERPTSFTGLKSAIKRKCDVKVYVQDRSESSDNWASYPTDTETKAIPERDFAVLLQDPTPDRLQLVLEAIASAAGILGEVQPLLLELAVDFYPRDQTDAGASLVTREQIVGLLHRHHWANSALLLTSAPEDHDAIDPRQIYEQGVKLRRFFAIRGSCIYSDFETSQPVVRKRILEARQDGEIYLNATIYRGKKYGLVQTNVQHKIADQRNKKSKTEKTLDDTERRGRVEVTLRSREILANYGFLSIEDLSKLSFRKLTKDLISFRLPTSATDAQALDYAIAQMRARGVHGVEMHERARAEEARLQNKLRKEQRERQNMKTAVGLQDWPEMNQAVGKATDRLKKVWSKFQWPQTG